MTGNLVNMCNVFWGNLKSQTYNDQHSDKTPVVSQTAEYIRTFPSNQHTAASFVFKKA